MKKKLHLIFTFILILFASANMFGQMKVVLTKTDIDSNSPTGSITANIVNGFPPYTYSWSNGQSTQTISNLSQGLYYVEVMDSNHNMVFANIGIGECFQKAKAIAVQTNASCTGAVNGSATVAVKGGSGSYSYLWNTPALQTTQSVTGLSAGSYTVRVTDNVTYCSTLGTVDIILAPTTSVGDPTVYGNNSWNVYAWNKGAVSGDAWQADYSGYFTANTLSFNSEDYFEDYDVPSSVAGYQGCKVNGDDHSWSAKRQGFPCGYYQIDIPMHDDWVRLFIDDVQVFGDNNCCESHTNVWQGFLDSNSKVEFRIAEERGQSRGNIKFNLIEHTASITNVSCNGGNNGAITLTVPTNGNYTYNWGNGITTKNRSGLAPGNYTVTVTNPIGCEKTSTYSVSQPDAIVITPSQTNVSYIGGSDGSATVAVTGGVGPYSYSWTPSGLYVFDSTAYFLTKGTYTVTVRDANNCTATQSFTITEPDALDATLVSQHNIDCHGANTGSITISATGGVAPYSYWWNHSGGNGATASGLVAGTYTVTVYDAYYNSVTKSFTITEPDALTATAAGQTNIVCHGANTGSATVSASGGTGSYTYSWAPSGGSAATASGLLAGNYTVTVTDDNNCTATQSFTITEPDAIVITPSQTNASCKGTANGSAIAFVRGGAGNYTYQWSPYGGRNASATGLAAGTYTVTVTDANSCTATKSFTITEPDALIALKGAQTNITSRGAATGSATVNVTGGTGSYYYSWAPSGGTSATATGLSAGTYTVTVTDDNTCTATQSFTITEPDELVASKVSQTNIACHGGATGSATVSVTGGTGAYSYSWSPSGGSSATATGLTAGTYTVTVTDANASTATQSFTITEPDALVISSSQTNASCKGTANGSAIAFVRGGAGNYTYQWSPSGGRNASATGLSAGIYTVTVTDANSCTATQNFTITEPDELVASKGSQTNIACHGGATGSATVSVTGGTGSYSYSWAPSGGTSATATGLEAGTYTVTVTDANNCTATQSFMIIEPAKLTATAVTQTNIACNGAKTGSATVSASGGTGVYTYSWSPSGGTSATATGLDAGTYTVTITDANSCTAMQSFTITEPSKLVASKGSQTNIACHGGATGSATVSVTGGTGSYSYSWAPSGGTSATATGLTAGTYTVTVTDANSCTAMQSFTIIQPASSLSATTASVAVSCFGGGNGSASVNVSGGSPNYTYSWAPFGGTSATATGLSAGDYICTITDSKGCTLTKTITVGTPVQISASITKTDVSCNGGSNGSATVTASGGVGAYSYSWAPAGGNTATASGLSKGNYTLTIQDGNTCTYTIGVTIDEPPVLTASISHTDVLCNGGATGTATVVPSGGSSSYSYLWSPSGGTAATATGLAVGIYSCKITDSNGCFITKSIEIDEPAVLSATTSQIDATCMSPGQAAVSVSGGVAPYTYLWSPSGQTTAIATGLNNGSYSCLITDSNGCAITKHFVINTTNTLTAVASQNDILCNGANTGSASVIPSGAPGPFTYVWAPTGGSSNTASNLAAGSYSVTITSANGCSIVKYFTITEPSVLKITPSQTNLLCYSANTGSATVSVSGGKPGYSYSWAPSGGNSATASGLSAGTYTVTVTDANSCTATQSFTIVEPNALIATAVSQTNIACNGTNTGSATVGVSGGKPGYSYSWAPSGGNSATASGLSAGTYTVTVTDANSCTATQSFTITEPALLEAITSKTDVTCYNGNDGTASVNVSGGKGAYTYLWSPKGGNEATASGLTAGTYSVTISDANSCSISKTIVIEEPAPFVVNTLVTTNITVSGAVVSGTISSEKSDGKCLAETGFVYSLKSNPMITDNKIIVGSSLGSITSTLTNLKGNTKYYVKAYAINSNGFVAYGNEVSFTTNKYTLTITASTGHQKVFGTNDPVFGYTVSGLVNGDTNTIIRGVLSRESGENAGKYKINAGTIDAGENYRIVFESSVFEITKADQLITWNQELQFGCETENNLNLNAISNSGLPITYSVANSNIAEVSGNNLVIKNSGSTLITASQNGDQNHNPAVAVIKTVEVTQGGLITQHWSDVLFFDNKNKDFVSWQWYKNGTAISGATRQYFSENQALNGAYYVIATDKNGNKIKSCLFEIKDQVFSNKMKIYPNPVRTSSEFTLECNFSEAQLKGAVIDIFDINGKLIQTVSNVKTQNQIIAPSQTAIYVVMLTLSNGEKKTINVLVK
ncbi:T9SS type A sorting domain-containing protein [Flavobacterium sp. KACC 22761]|uniref:T9SS type A sorting domain-containing protein n=1 Tax=Flavobacterium sp. KACC 22761 TaxID=3092665 RepID=UPI002A7603B7|nr:T9SS type A sorting domain-containing protein [Flavobacterium sp. KACC 22761]WPO78269.1 T9SS type A sorting domain-containing protein [Flavobacterium sp. KACC 22761]